LGIGGYFFFNQNFSPINILGLISMAICLFMISLESKKSLGHWQWGGILFGLIAIFLDGCGVLLTRYSFESEPNIHSLLVNMYRTIGAVITFFFIHTFKEKVDLIGPFKKLPSRDKKRVLIGSLLGTFISLLLYLTAISKGKLSVVSAVTITGPMFAAVFECVKNKKLPSKYLLASIIFFTIGFYLFYSTRR
jgi:drug/metabolite transporter (DMT)-like permease